VCHRPVASHRSRLPSVWFFFQILPASLFYNETRTGVADKRLHRFMLQRLRTLPATVPTAVALELIDMFVANTPPCTVLPRAKGAALVLLHWASQAAQALMVRALLWTLHSPRPILPRHQRVRALCIREFALVCGCVGVMGWGWSW
jgi:hypothetical protein